MTYEDTAHELREAADRLDLVTEGDGFVAVIMRTTADMLSRGTKFGCFCARKSLGDLLEPMPIDGRTLLEYGRDVTKGKHGESYKRLAYSVAEDAIRRALEQIEVEL
jgi:hypothetical protein